MNDATHVNEESVSWEIVPERDGVRLRAIGALDVASAPALEMQLADLRESGFEKLTLDLRALTFMDSTGLRLVLRWDAAARRDGFEFWVVPGPRQVQRVFELTDTARLVAFASP
jgi:anti-sigma B factor antagonist